MDCVFIEVLENDEHPYLCSDYEGAAASFKREAEVECRTRGHARKGGEALDFLGWDYYSITLDEARDTYGTDWVNSLERIN